MSALSHLIEEAEQIALISHINPDGDAIGSLLGLQMGLEGLGKRVTSTLVSPVPEIFRFLPQIEEIKSQLPAADGRRLCLVLDAGDLARTGCSEVVQEYGRQGRLGVIDHHPKGDLARLKPALLHDEKAPATALLVHQLLSELGARITPSCATALLTGLYTDTGGFQHANTTTATLEVAAELMRRGARLNLIATRISHTKSIAGLKLLGLALERLRLTRQGSCAISALSYQDLQRCQAKPEDMAGIIGEMNVLPQVHFSLLLVELEPGTIRGTMRTGEEQQTNVSRLAKFLGGGGHPRAAGFSLPGRLLIHDNATWEIVAE